MDSGTICLQPFYFMEFTTSGDVYTCCPSWVKFSIGNIRGKTIDELWNSDAALYLRKEIYEGKWEKICNPVCPRIAAYRHDKKRMTEYSEDERTHYLTPRLIEEIGKRRVSLDSSPTVFNLSNSKVCNLSCIMCVRDSQVDDLELLRKTADDIMGHLPTARRIIMSGMGDPFARPDTRDLLMNYRGENPELKFQIITNGLLLPKYWEKIKHQSFDSLLISVDASTKETYEKIRKGGSWESLLESLSLAKENRDRFRSVTINMTVMGANYREIPSFIDFAESHGFNVSFQRIRGTWADQNIFEMKDAAALSELGRTIMNENSKKRDINVFWGDLLDFQRDDKEVPRSVDVRWKKLSDSTLCSNGRVLPLSVIICTYNRADLLSMVMDSLIHQTLPQDQFEIVVIDDGSLDGTRKVVQSFMDRLPIRYFYQHNAGLSSAKNHGIYASQGGILLFLDDDDSAAPTLLEEHIGTHREYPEEHYAVLHYTTWAPHLPVTPLMHFVTEVGCFLFSYPYITHGDILDYTYFWGGRSSCKRSFLIEHGVFNPIFRFGCEDIELGYRLSKHGLRVVYNSRAKGMMIRPLAFDDFCRRLIKQGRSQYIFSRMHEEPAVQEWTEVLGAEEKWKNIEPVFEAKLRSARELDKIVNTRLKYGIEIDNLTRRLVERSYWWAFRACKLKAIAEARNEGRSTFGHQAVTASLEDARTSGDEDESRTTEAVITASDNRA